MQGEVGFMVTDDAAAAQGEIMTSPQALLHLLLLLPFYSPDWVAEPEPLALAEPL